MKKDLPSSVLTKTLPSSGFRTKESDFTQESSSALSNDLLLRFRPLDQSRSRLNILSSVLLPNLAVAETPQKKTNTPTLVLWWGRNSIACIVDITNMDVEMEDAIFQEGDVLRDIRYLDKAGLQPTADLYVRSTSIGLLRAFTLGSCVVQGPPGVGKSTTVWLMLLRKVLAMDSSSNCRALWCHFRPSGASTYVVITTSPQGEFQFKPIKPSGLSTEESFAVCVMDGVRQSNHQKVNELCDELVYDQMVWVTSQQIVIPQETLLELGWEEFCYPSWSREEINSYVVKMSQEEKNRLILDFTGTMAGRLDDRDYSIDEVIDSKHWFFGGSARYMFGLTMEKAIADLKNHIAKIHDVELIFRGLTGSRGLVAVNHIISHFPEDSQNEFHLLSPYVVELLSEKMGFAAIKMFYRSSWVQGNPSVHGFVFEWDLFTQVSQYGELTLSSDEEGNLDTTWIVDQNISLKSFVAGKGTASRIMVRPEKWNHPEYDGLYIHTNQQGERELVAWNASEAEKHSGSVRKLCLFLREIGNRSQDPLIFGKVRFVFVIPKENIGSFRLPSDSDDLVARNQLRAWHFPGFEVLGGRRTVEEH